MFCCTRWLKVCPMDVVGVCSEADFLEWANFFFLASRGRAHDIGIDSLFLLFVELRKCARVALFTVETQSIPVVVLNNWTSLFLKVELYLLWICRCGTAVFIS